MHSATETQINTHCNTDFLSVEYYLSNKKAISTVAVTKMNDPQTELLARGKMEKYLSCIGKYALNAYLKMASAPVSCLSAPEQIYQPTYSLQYFTAEFHLQQQ